MSLVMFSFRAVLCDGRKLPTTCTATSLSAYFSENSPLGCLKKKKAGGRKNWCKLKGWYENFENNVALYCPVPVYCPKTLFI